MQNYAEREIERVYSGFVFLSRFFFNFHLLGTSEIITFTTTLQFIRFVVTIWNSITNFSFIGQSGFNKIMNFNK